MGKIAPNWSSEYPEDSTVGKVYIPEDSQATATNQIHRSPVNPHQAVSCDREPQKRTLQSTKSRLCLTTVRVSDNLRWLEGITTRTSSLF